MRKSIHTIFTSFWAVIFAVNTLCPAQVALALRECGAHEIVSCKTHNDAHLVARHRNEQVNSVPGGTTNSLVGRSSPDEEHDAAHQIERCKPAISTVSATPFKVVKILLAPQDFAQQPTNSNLSQEVLWPNAPPMVSDYLLSFLPSIRIQV
ncbi:MAG: hypothetical protein KDD42_08945 [Bdellovibrionales bacterium]|nr:hypothetical protein [Bdellovibrionales bacterium]